MPTRKERNALHLVWTPFLALGISTIDDQHRELFRRFNSLIDALTEGSANEDLPGLVRFLEDYTVTHFGMEETAMDRYGYGAADAHKAQHAKFVEDISSLKQRLQASGPARQLAIDTAKELADWLLRHVQGTDQDLGRFLRVAMPLRKAA
jgi:hemerythrin